MRLHYRINKRYLTTGTRQPVSYTHLDVYKRQILEFLRGFNTKNVFSGLEVAYRGMADAFAGVEMCIRDRYEELGNIDIVRMVL